MFHAVVLNTVKRHGNFQALYEEYVQLIFLVTMIVHKHILFSFFVVLSLSGVAGSISDKTVLLIKGLGWKRIDVVYSETSWQETKSWVSLGQQNAIGLRLLNQTNIDGCSEKTSFPVVFIASSSTWQAFADCISKRKAYSSVLIIPQSIDKR